MFKHLSNFFRPVIEFITCENLRLLADIFTYQVNRVDEIYVANTRLYKSWQKNGICANTLAADRCFRLNTAIPTSNKYLTKKL